MLRLEVAKPGCCWQVGAMLLYTMGQAGSFSSPMELFHNPSDCILLAAKLASGACLQLDTYGACTATWQPT